MLNFNIFLKNLLKYFAVSEKKRNFAPIKMDCRRRGQGREVFENLSVRQVN